MERYAKPAASAGLLGPHSPPVQAARAHRGTRAALPVRRGSPGHVRLLRAAPLRPAPLVLTAAFPGPCADPARSAGQVQRQGAGQRHRALPHRYPPPASPHLPPFPGPSCGAVRQTDEARGRERPVAGWARTSGNTADVREQVRRPQMKTPGRQECGKLSYAGAGGCMKIDALQRCARPREAAAKLKAQVTQVKTGPVSSVGRASPW